MSSNYSGDSIRSAVRWVREAAAGHAREEYDDHMHTSYEHRYWDVALRSRRSLQQCTLGPDDPMSNPSLFPGARPPSAEERMAALVRGENHRHHHH